MRNIIFGQFTYELVTSICFGISIAGVISGDYWVSLVAIAVWLFLISIHLHLVIHEMLRLSDCHNEVAEQLWIHTTRHHHDANEEVGIEIVQVTPEEAERLLNSISYIYDNVEKDPDAEA